MNRTKSRCIVLSHLNDFLHFIFIVSFSLLQGQEQPSDSEAGRIVPDQLQVGGGAQVCPAQPDDGWTAGTGDTQVEEQVFAGMTTIKFLREMPSFRENLNNLSSGYLLMTSFTTLANEGLFDLTLCPSLTRAVLLSYTERLRNQVVVR